MKIKIKKLDKDFNLPIYKTNGSVGMDLYYNYEDIELEPLNRYILKTGICIELPNEFEGQVRGRSGLFIKQGLLVATGTIDSDYRGEIGVMCINLDNNPIKIEKGTRIAQLIINKIEKVELEEVEILSETERKGGFGSTGIK